MFKYKWWQQSEIHRIKTEKYGIGEERKGKKNPSLETFKRKIKIAEEGGSIAEEELRWMDNGLKVVRVHFAIKRVHSRRMPMENDV